jgi:hypothetical protein
LEKVASAAKLVYLAVATKRQQEIVAALDITKNQASSRVDEGAEQPLEIIEQGPRQNARPDNKNGTIVSV